MNQRVLDFLNGLREADEASHLTNYSVYIGGREVTVTVYDRGEGAGAIRYAASADWARPDEEVLARGGSSRSNGNPSASLEDALDNVHWGQFAPRDDD